MFSRRNKKGFTLIELLVVISIIALLLSILMPSLGRVRNAAKLTVCAVNCRQIAPLIGLYQADNDDKLPILMAHWAWWALPAQNVGMSLALKEYVEASNLPPNLNPENIWTYDEYMEYAGEHITKFFMCPYMRNKKYTANTFDSITLSGPGGTRSYFLANENGESESYITCMFGSKEDNIFESTHPYGLPSGKMAVAKAQWYNDPSLSPTPWEFPANTKLKPTTINAQAKKLGSISSRMALLNCDMGETIQGDWILNYKSHYKKGGRGGTNVLFADFHVEWIDGSQYGWHTSSAGQ